MVSTRGQKKLATSGGEPNTKKPTSRPRRTTALRKSQVDAKKVSKADEAERIEDDSDLEQSTSRGKKRVKKSRKTSETKKSGKSFKNVLSIPFDIQLEIFSWLHPKDLISLSRTSKVLRQSLMQHSALGIWKLTRESEGIPQPPPTLSERQWATLLFGGSTCSECGASGIHSVDFGILRRVCGACKKANLVGPLKFRKKLPEYDETILEMVPYTNVVRWSHGLASHNKHYWLEDIYDIHKQWAMHKDAIYRQAPGARQKAEEFHQARAKLVIGIAKAAELCIDWDERLRKSRADEIRDQVKIRRDEILKRFADMGYEQIDINVIEHSQELSEPRPLTDRVWNRIRPILEAQIQKSRHNRAVGPRKQKFKDIYERYVKTLPPREWPCYPSITDVLDLPIFNALLDTRWDLDVNAADFQAVLPLLPEAVRAMRETKKSELTELILAHHSKTHAANKARPRKKAKGHPAPDPLNLATSVFVCANCGGCKFSYGRAFANAWFGWEGTLLHSCYDPWTPFHTHVFERKQCKMLVPEGGFALAVELVKDVGLDPETAVIGDMDRVGAKWFCTSCPYNNDMVYDWRSVIAHALSSSHVETPLVRQRLSDYQLSHVETIPRGFNDMPRRWGCAHCDVNFKNWETMEVVKQHLIDKHNIDAPVESEDMVHFSKRCSFEFPTEWCQAPHQPEGNSNLRYGHPSL